MAKFKSKQEALSHIQGGKKFKIIVNLGGIMSKDSIHSCSVYGANAYLSGNYVALTLDNGAAYNITLSQMEPLNESKESLEQELEAAQVVIVLVQAKLNYLKETQQETFDETEFKVWNTLQILSQKKMTDLERSKAIAALIKS